MTCPKCGKPMLVVIKNITTGKVMYKCHTPDCNHRVWVKEVGK